MRRPVPKGPHCYVLPPMTILSDALMDRLQLAELALANIRAEALAAQTEPDTIVCLSRIRRHLAEFDHGRADPPPLPAWRDDS